MKKERKHHPYSPSQLANFEVCPCYKGKDSKHIRTIAGTIAHGVTETGRDDNRLSDEDAAAAAECLDFVESRRRLMQAQADAQMRADAIDLSKTVDPTRYRVKEFKEQYLLVDDIDYGDGVKGTTAGYVDLCLMNWDSTYAELVDYKFGLWPVEDAKYNLQGLSYILGLFKKYKKLARVKFFFKQPHLGTISDAEITRANIPSIYLRIQVVVARAREAAKLGDFSMANPTVPVCNFCANIGRCPKVAEIMLRISQKYYPLGVPENITPGMLMSMQDTKQCLNVATIAPSWADSFKRLLNDAVLRGVVPVPEGTALVSKQDREIVDKDAFRAVGEQYLGPKEFADCCTPSFGACEEKISERAPRGEKTAAVKEFGEALLKAKAVVLGPVYAYLRTVPTKK